MSERDKSIAGDAQKIAEALGSEAPVYIGRLTITDFISGPVWWNVEQTRRQREEITRALGLSEETFPQI